MEVSTLARAAFFILSPVAQRLFTIQDNVLITCLIATIALCTGSTNDLFINLFLISFIIKPFVNFMVKNSFWRWVLTYAMTWDFHEILLLEAFTKHNAGEITYEEAFNIYTAHLEGTHPGNSVQFGVMVAVVIWAWHSGSALPDTVLGWFKLYLSVSIITCSAYSFTVQMFPMLPIAWEAYKHANAAHVRAKLRPVMERQDAIIMEQALF
jgi:hypothetical protein